MTDTDRPMPPRTAAMAAASAANGKHGGRPRKNLDDIPCTCGADDAALAEHKFACRRRLADYRRRLREREAGK